MSGIYAEEPASRAPEDRHAVGVAQARRVQHQVDLGAGPREGIVGADHDLADAALGDQVAQRLGREDDGVEEQLAVLEAANNGSAFAGLTANSPFYNVTLGIGMLLGRFGMIVPMLAVAGSLAAKKRLAPSAGTLPTDGGLFVGLLVGVILIVGGLTFFPALALGPIVEHLAMLGGTLF